ncbi:YggS family pyridoxal phosphate-dependent enzyme [Herbiconiux moechotypicola]|uniref:Pyridoxal phosphate homeostasis protein n=1 Tax=Herbiconiux moechotypicola TaxID=637393 RepID=A0ABP5QJZ1_9MICO|nr:YggS family pyridoxal phosphate-dependent enzyme [Herbiconiux moechotypicola]MCS5730483.1 YggS family pyridoxal phosphate-dependent enzyme [Herbiconiux moechotypicola]
MVEPEGTLADRLAAMRAGIADAARASGREPEELTLIAVTKFHPASLVRALHALGVRDFGENRHQEAREKAAELADLDGVHWHFVGQLQSKKARQVREYASVVHSIDREALVTALARPADGEATLDAFLQVNLTDDPARGGARPDDAPRLAELIATEAATGLRLRGVMAVAPLGEEPRRAFARLKAISEQVAIVVPTATEISAGMSHDFREAIAEGATHLRIGTAITGPRPSQE